MLSRKEFIQMSLEVNLFFQRIMKEHMFFMEIAFYPVNAEYMNEAEILKKSFEELLTETIPLANGAIDEGAIKSNQFVTNLTLPAEEMSSKLSGAGLDTTITKAELNLTSDPYFDFTEGLESLVYNVNCRAINLVEEVIDFKERILKLIGDCTIAINLYPTLIRHILREAKLYREILISLQDNKLPNKTLCEDLNFWNTIMGEHTEFIDGLLDPEEVDLKKTASDFAKLFEGLVEECPKSQPRNIINKSLRATKGVRDFETAGTEGLLACKIESLIIPLLGDHTIREANHFIRLLEMMK